MGGRLAIALLALVGLLCAAGMGVAAYVVSRDSVAVPVTRLQPKPSGLTPAKDRSRQRTQPRTTATTRSAPPPPPATTDDHGGRRGGGGGDDNSGHGGGGGDD